MSNEEHPAPQLMEMHPDDAAHKGRGFPRLGGCIIVAALALSALAVVHQFGADPAHSGHTGTNQTTAEVAAAPTGTQTPATASHMGADLPMIPEGRAALALAHSNYSTQDQARILAAYKRRDISLVQMPIAEIDGKAGTSVKIDTGGFSQIVTLSPALKAVTIPIYHAGEVTISPVHMLAGNTLAASVLTVYGMYNLPTLSSSELVTLDVIAQ